MEEVPLYQPQSECEVGAQCIELTGGKEGGVEGGRKEGNLCF